jgi:LysM repeat protein
MRYVVKPGDSLSKIASAHGLSLAQLLAANPQLAADPNSIGVGDVVTIPTPVAPASPPPPAGEAQALGKLSERYETGGRGPGVVSTGTGDAGGASYGSYQMTSKNGGTVRSFVSQPGFRWSADFQGLVPGSSEFTAKWKAIAAAEPEAFHAAQHEYIKRTHFDVLVQNILDRDALDVRTRSHALQDVVWSTAVQHGPNTAVLHNALTALPRDATPDTGGADFDRSLIKAIYAERGRHNAEGQLVYFSKNSAQVQAGVAQRFVDEERDALRMLDG